MIELKDSPTLEKRIIHHVRGQSKGPTLVFFGGIHGNEKAGVEALKNVLPQLKKDNICGQIFGVYGNIKAINQNKRYIDKDLNRIWTTQFLNDLEDKTIYSQEEQEQKALFKFISGLLSNNTEPVYFIDFHTTSSKTLPFITINDAIINRKFSKHFPVPVVLGIEEYLEGPLLSYLNKQGFVSLGFEAGQHNDKAAIINCESFIHLACHYSGALKERFNEFKTHYQQLQKSAKNKTDIYEVIYKYHINENENFKMEHGFESFQPIKKGILLATSNQKPIYAPSSHELFMPLYQEKGNDGFFIIKRIPRFILEVSALVRKLKLDGLLTLLPGIKWHDKTNGILRANLRITRFMAKSIFHLLGYRNKQQDDTHLLLYNRERVAKTEMYKKAPWYT
ncbi:succinylglutamate desuccinylase/aspartoacylase family protein [Winogradskyella sp.]|uniref:succinylglutamate desuccinylase/aspartoacylase family protein n=1 Tax=Winogradskyella sp. TaxID=1883156 RepID=UPI0025F05464|nr:succinylglutamate desuccinylase/aspartoacylase family protein [Winogradskyella sp.]MBT8245883.1 succinylglutamate desuccinylase/aspartoacylase family protein [Winogradskyella sp.]